LIAPFAFHSFSSSHVQDFSASAHVSGGAGGPSGPYLDGDIVLLLLEYLIEASGPQPLPDSASRSEKGESEAMKESANNSSESHVALAHGMETHALALFGQVNDILYHFFAFKPYLLTETIYKLFRMLFLSKKKKKKCRVKVTTL
jgi:hypothetical protein